ncbi:diaminopimelate epimerase [Limosilactobacillus equigenerosi]|uniref:Diaminopimelate epimerase n=1 Tax=Limosilactobacillus equigenerosi DSM 18793 = JCM 14505 TaxID=1423742 RepID=A0A0R1USN7_9LACO|nr:diaminopimelate epimerase [Limosilactobacillus equigenerosi]KRL92955.1 diaminopimelate epimerase [Limosilactobacillus equigenerosi DSM 18793 = JCM 14505]
MVELTKVHGSMNQFFILDQTLLDTPLTDEELSALAQQMTNPTTGVLDGSDGILVVDHSEHDGVLAQMRVINADGSEASMCGNGLRTVARYLAQKHGETDFLVETMYADLRVRQQPDFAPGVPAFAVEISPVKFDRTDLPFENLGRDRIVDEWVPEIAPGLKFTTLAVPNPHLISFMDHETLHGDLLGEVGTWLNGDNPYFTDGVNVNFAEILGKNELFVRTFERGVGFTNACGTGMSATTLAFALSHPELADFNTPITVYNPGGMVKTILHHNNHQYWIELIGNAAVTHHFTVDEQLLHDANVTPDQIDVVATDEQAAYDQFVASLKQ